MGGRVSACCEEKVAVPDVNGAYVLEAPIGWHELWFAAHGAIGDGRLVEFAAGEPRVEPEMDLLPWTLVNDARAGDPCPRHRDQVLRLCTDSTLIYLDDLELFARFPFPGSADWGRCLTSFLGKGEVLRCESCAREAELAAAD
jgi:hypothetical protein